MQLAVSALWPIKKKTAKMTVFGPSRLYFSADFDQILDHGAFLVVLQLRFT